MGVHTRERTGVLRSLNAVVAIVVTVVHVCAFLYLFFFTASLGHVAENKRLLCMSDV